jgi:signal transduction histidine kinase
VEIMESVNNNIMNCPTVLTGMSHELRTNMNAIVAFSFLMKENGSNSTEREEFNNQILSSCEQIIELFDSFLDSAIIDAGNSKADPRICKLNNMLDELFSEFRETISKKGHTDLELIKEIGFPNSTEVLIDQNKVSRVIRSLFQNSMKNTKSGYIKIGYLLRNGKLTFYVLDSGQGYQKCKEFLDSNDLNASLAQYYDLYTAVNIALTKNLIQTLGGTIWIERNGRTGTGIYFSIPMKMKTFSENSIKKLVNSMITI